MNIDKETAQKILDLLFSIDKPLDEVLELLKDNQDDDCKPIRKATRKVAIDIYADIMIPIFKKYPDLHSEKYYK